MRTDGTELIGFIAAACTTLAFVPQLLKIRRQGGRDLSYLMLGVYFGGLCLWLVYGVRLRAPAIIAANIVAILLVAATIVLKVRMDRSMRAAELVSEVRTEEEPTITKS